MRDAPITLSNGTKWPHNYNMKSTPDNGDVLLGVALQKSLNPVAARLVQELTPQRSFDYATKTFQLSTLVEAKAVNGSIKTDIALSPMALGAFTDGVTVREMAAAYGVYGSGGFYNKPFTYYKVVKGEDESTSTLLTGGKKSTMVLDEETCYVMLRLMNRVTTYGTAADIAKSWPGWETYGKTGTSESNRDVYFTGGTAYYVAASWFGYDNNQVMIGTQTGYARRLWNLAMKALHKNLEIKGFTAPEGVKTLQYCTATGQLATDACPGTDTGYYKSVNIPPLCSAHPGNPLNVEDTSDATTEPDDGSTGSTTTSETGSATGTTTTTGEAEPTTTATTTAAAESAEDTRR